MFFYFKLCYIINILFHFRLLYNKVLVDYIDTFHPCVVMCL